MNQDTVEGRLHAAWKAAVREAKTTVGRRARGAVGVPPPVAARTEKPAGVQGLVLQEDESGWGVVDRKTPTKKVVQPVMEEPVVQNAPYLVGGEGCDEDGE